MSAAQDIIFRLVGVDNASPAFLKAARSAETASARIARVGGRMTAAGRVLTRSVTLPVVALGVESVRAATTFSSAMTKIHTQAGGSARDVAILSKQVLDLAQSAQQGPTELANSLYHLKSVGMDNVSAMKALKQASDLAAVGGASLEETTNALAGAWRTGITGAKNFHQAVATLNAIIGAGNMRMEDLTAALGTGILPTAKTFGLTLKDVGSALALFTDEGVPADAAATRLRMSISLLGAPSKAAEKQLKKIGLTGLALAQDMRRPNGLIVAIGDLKDHLEKSGLSASKQAILLSHAFGGGRSSSAILSMINNFDVLQKKQDQVTKSIGKYGDAVKTQAKTPAAQFHLLESSLQRSAIMIGNDLIPGVITAAKDVGTLAEKFNHLPDATKHTVVDVLLIAAALGPVLSIGGRIVMMFARIGSVAGRAAKFMAAPYRQTAEQAQLASLQVKQSLLGEQLAAERSAALFAVAEAEKARVASETAVQIAAAVEGTNSVLAAGATAAAEDAIEFAAAQQTAADAAVLAAAKTDAAWTAATVSMRAEMAGASSSAFGLQSAMAGLGIGLTVGSFTRGASKSTKLLGALGSAGAGAAIGLSMGGPVGAAIGGLAGGLSSLAVSFLHTGKSSSQSGDAAVQAAKRAQAAVAQTKQTVDDLTTAIETDSGAWKANTKAAVANALQKSGATANAASAGINPALLPKAILGNRQAEKQIEDEAARIQDRVAALEKHGGEQMVPTALLLQRDAARKLLGELQKLGVETRQASVRADQLALTEGKLNLATRAVSTEAHRAGVQLEGNSAAAVQNRNFLAARIGVINKSAAAEFAHGASIRKVSVDSLGQLAALEKVMRQNGYNAESVKELGQQYLRLPKKVATSTSVKTIEAKAAVADLQRRINAVKQNHVPGYHLDTAQGQLLLKLLQLRLDGIKQHGAPAVKVNTGAASADLDRIITKMHTIGQGVNAVVNIRTTNTGTGQTNTVYARAAGGGLPTGWTSVGEAGPELIYNTGAGAHVFSNGASRAIVAASGMRAPGFAGGTSGTSDTVKSLISGIGQAPSSSSQIDLSNVGIIRVRRQIEAAAKALRAAIAKGLDAKAAKPLEAEIAKLSRQADRQLAHLKVKIDTSDVKALDRALTGSASDIGSAIRQLVTDARHAGEIPKSVIATIRAGNAELDALAHESNKIQARLDTAQQSLDQARQQLASDTASYAQALGSFDAVTAGTVTDTNGVTSASLDGLIGGLESQVGQVQALASGLAGLKGEGLDAGLLAQLATPGASGLVQQIAQGGPAVVAQLNALWSQLQAAADAGGKTVATALDGAGVAAAQGLVKGLKSQEKAIIAEAQHIADAIAKTIEKALDIHSPSKVTEKLGRHAGEGLALGLVNSTSRVVAASKDLGKATLPKFDGAPTGSTGGDSPLLAELRELREQVAGLRGDVHVASQANAEAVAAGVGSQLVESEWRGRLGSAHGGTQSKGIG